MAAAQEPKKLVLCFDGTGNTFSGSNADTNVVKILNKLDRNAPRQHHYYQTGIGTYDINDRSVNKSLFRELRSSLSKKLDQGFGITFDAHVMAGYRFLMRYYESGAKIYVFGFSRGALTAKFLARMINTVGLLCMGNEELVPFAFRLYQRYLQGEIETVMEAQPNLGKPGNGTQSSPAVQPGQTFQEARDEVTAFSQTFCRKDDSSPGDVERNIKVYFLGIWDCVNSVAVLERHTPIPVPIKGTAEFVRHAVAVDERRVKFKAALLAQDIRATVNDPEDIKEVWFPGCHGDVGGGWPACAENPLDSNKPMTPWQRFTNFWTTRKPKGASTDVCSDPFQMSDIPLAWMIHELELVGQRNPAAAVKWRDSVNGFKRRFVIKKDQALRAPMHDALRFGRGTGFFTVLMWKFIEYIPFISRWELEGNMWKNVHLPLNKGDTRDIPRDAVLHASLLWRLRNDPSYCPSNNHGDDENGNEQEPCLRIDRKYIPVVDSQAPPDPDHQTYTFDKTSS